MTETAPSENEIAFGRFQHGVIGTIAGLSLWFCFNDLPEFVDSERLLAFLSAFLMIFFSSTLLMTGPISLLRAAAASLALSVFGAGFFLWASFRFDNLNDFLETAHSVAALALFSLVSLPFLVTAQLPDTSWRNYNRLFDQAWSMFVRGVIGAAFSGLFWLILVASDALLSLVGIGVIDTLMEQGWFSSGFTGATFGLALGVLNEQRRIVSTVRGLALRLLRLLLPVVAIVGTVFVAMLPIRGLDQVFGDLSAAGTLIAMAMVGISLVAAAVDGTDDNAAASRIMVAAARLMCIILPVIAGLALYALWIRVTDYGWTPERISGAVVAGVLCGYGIWHVASFVRGGSWRSFIRTGNTMMALAVIALSALFLTPILNPEGISARDQIARFEAGLSEPGDLPLHDLRANWGTAGAEAWARLEAITDHPQQARLDRLMRFEESDSPPQQRDYEAIAIALSSVLPVRPDGAGLPDGYLEAVPDYYVSEILTACETPRPGAGPLCVAVLGDLNLAMDGEEVVLVWAPEREEEVRFATISRAGSGEIVFEAYAATFGTHASAASAEQILRAILAGEYAIREPEFRILDLGEMQVLPPLSR